MPDPQEQIQELIESNDELENYFRNTIIPQLFVDANLVLRKFTPPAMKQFSLKLSDVGRPIADIKDNFRFPSILDNIEQVMKSKEILEKEIQTTDMRWFQMNVIPYVTIKEKKTNGVIITFVDITTRIKDLQEQEKLISDHETLLDIISHDIKSPLTSLLLAVELFKESSKSKNEQYPGVLLIVENSIRKIETLINELAVTRKSGHKDKSDSELLSFENILEDVRVTIAELINSSGARIKTDINVSEVNFPRRKLRSIIYNLVSNAIKFRVPGRLPEILIKTECEDDFTVITVKDNGKGIDPEKQEDIFSKYFRLENAIEGSGIGLYLVKTIVTDAGGKVTLQSIPGEGSEFKIYLKSPGSNCVTDPETAVKGK